MSLLEVIHRAVDYFFCDRCPFECSFYKDGSDCWIWWHWRERCFLSKLWDFLPEEPYDSHHPIRWPRSWLGNNARIDEGKQNDGEIR